MLFNEKDIDTSIKWNMVYSYLLKDDVPFSTVNVAAHVLERLKIITGYAHIAGCASPVLVDVLVTVTL